MTDPRPEPRCTFPDCPYPNLPDAIVHISRCLACMDLGSRCSRPECHPFAPSPPEPVSPRAEEPSEPIDVILAEVGRATAKFPTWPTDALHAVSVVGEEYGELVKAALQCTYEPHKSNRADVREEAIQTAAMAVRFVMSLDRYEYEPCEQHAQSAEPQEDR